MNQQVILNRIRTLLSRFEEEVRIDNANGEFGSNTHAENVLIKVLNVAYSIELKNKNYVEGKTVAAIDLGDDSNRIAFQISSTGTVDKVVDTLIKFEKNQWEKKYEHLYFYFLKGMDKDVVISNKRIIKVKGKLKEENIHFLDHAQFYKYLNQINDMEKYIEIQKLLEEQFADLYVLECSNGFKENSNTLFSSVRKNVTNTKRLNNNQIGYFANKWRENLFLHRDLKLCDIYTPLHANIKTDKKILYDKDIESEISDFLIDNKRDVLLILGNPGLGKSSLFSKFAFQLNGRNDCIFIRFLDLEPRIAKKSLLDAITEFLGCNTRDLRDTTLFIDGYDELRVDGLHYSLCLDLITQLRQLKVKAIISSRQNYIDLYNEDFDQDYKNAVVAILLPLKNEQIKEYIKNYMEKTKEQDKKLLVQFERNATDSEVFGIPFILYLICSSKIDISRTKTKVDIFNKIFAFDGGIFDKIYDPETVHYLTQNPLIKRDLLSISGIIAYEMFRTGWLPLSINAIDKEILCQYPNCKKTYAIGNYYHVENNKLYFVHKTIQEYFFCRHLILSIKTALNDFECKKTNANEAANHIFELLYCDNYLYHRLETNLQDILKLKEYKLDEGYVQTFIKLLPDLYNCYLEKVFKDTNAINKTLKSQNYLSSLHKLTNIMKIDSFLGVDSYKVALVLRSKQYVRLTIKNYSDNGSDLSSSFLRGVLNGCRFTNTNFNRCDLSNSRIYDDFFIDCKMNMLLFRDSVIRTTTFEKTTISYSDFKKSHFYSVSFQNGCEIRDITIQSTKFRSCKFSNIRFINCKFIDSQFVESYFYDCDFENSFFIKCKFTKTYGLDESLMIDEKKLSEITHLIRETINDL